MAVEGWRQVATNTIAVAIATFQPTQATTFAVPRDPINTITGFGFYQQLSVASSTPRRVVGEGLIFVVNTSQAAVPLPPQGWWAKSPDAAQAVKAVATQATVFAVPRDPVNTTTQIGWYQPLSIPAKVAKAQPGFAAVPFNTVQINTTNISKWQQPLSTAVPVAKAQQGFAFVPFDTAQIPIYPVALVNDSSTPGSRLVYYQALFNPPFNTAQIVTAPPQGWQQPLSVAVGVAKAQVGSSFVPFNTTQTVTTIPQGWSGQTSKAATLAAAVPTQTTTFAVPASQSNSVTGFGWYQPLSVAAGIAKAQLGSSFVPFNTAQTIATIPQGWQPPLSVAAAVGRPVHTPVAFIGLPFAQYSIAWQQPLPGAAPVAKAQQGLSFVPFNTAQIAAVVVTYDKYQQPLSIAVPVAKAQAGYSFVPFDAVQVTPAAVRTVVGKVFQSTTRVRKRELDEIYDEWKATRHRIKNKKAKKAFENAVEVVAELEALGLPPQSLESLNQAIESLTKARQVAANIAEVVKATRDLQQAMQDQDDEEALMVLGIL